VKKETQSAKFKKDLLPLPGQSVDNYLDHYLSDTVDVDIVMLLFCVYTLTLIWVFELTSLVVDPLVFSVILVICITVLAIRLYRARFKIKRLKQGRDGERFVGQKIEEMRIAGYQVFHDIDCGGFNIDHVLIGPHGVYAIETKTWSKKSSKDSVTYVDGVLKKNGFALDKDPLEQARANASWVRNFLRESTGKYYKVQAVVLLPDWFIPRADTARAKKDGVYLLNPKALSAYITAGQPTLAPENYHLAAYHTAVMSKQHQNSSTH